MTTPRLAPTELHVALCRYRHLMQCYALDLLHSDWVSAQEHADAADHLFEVMSRSLPTGAR